MRAAAASDESSQRHRHRSVSPSCLTNAGGDGDYGVSSLISDTKFTDTVTDTAGRGLPGGGHTGAGHEVDMSSTEPRGRARSRSTVSGTAALDAQASAAAVVPTATGTGQVQDAGDELDSALEEARRNSELCADDYRRAFVARRRILRNSKSRLYSRKFGMLCSCCTERPPSNPANTRKAHFAQDSDLIIGGSSIIVVDSELRTRGHWSSTSQRFKTKSKFPLQGLLGLGWPTAQYSERARLATGDDHSLCEPLVSNSLAPRSCLKGLSANTGTTEEFAPNSFGLAAQVGEDVVSPGHSPAESADSESTLMEDEQQRTEVTTPIPASVSETQHPSRTQSREGGGRKPQ